MVRILPLLASDKDESGIKKFISVVSKPSTSKLEIIYWMYRRLGSVCVWLSDKCPNFKHERALL